jgi:hypothetical protein
MKQVTLDLSLFTLAALFALDALLERSVGTLCWNALLELGIGNVLLEPLIYL